jgi:DNA-binding CsgD family transcriptional regulator
VLQALGLTASEQDLYEMLLTHPPFTMQMLKELTVDRLWTADSETALRRLEELALIARLPTDPPRFVVVPADAGLEPLIANRERGLIAARQRMNQLTVRYRQAVVADDPLELVEVVHGREAVQTRVKELYRTVRNEMRGIDAPPYLADPLAGNDDEVELLRQGIRYRVLYDQQAVGLPGRTPEIARGVAVGEEARVTDVGLKMLLSESAAMVPLHSDPVDLETWLVVHDSVLLDALSALFEMYWERAVPLHTSQERQDHMAGHDSPSETERALLSLLAAGQTDQSIAQSLGWHERTAHRRLREMIKRLDSATRFQAGYQAVRRGWLTDTRDDVDETH